MVQAHLPIPGIVALTIDYVWDSQTGDDLREAHRAEFWEACDERTTPGNARHSMLFAYEAGNEGIIRMIAAREGAAVEFNACLEAAAIHGDERIVRVLIDVGATEAGGALSAAAENGYLLVVQHILREYPRLAIRWYDAFLRACHSGHADVCRELLAVSSPPRDAWSAITSIAARKGHDDIIRLALEHGAADHLPAVHWESAMNIAGWKGNTSTVALIADIIKNAPGRPP
jgi:hypothetical protein